MTKRVAADVLAVLAVLAIPLVLAAQTPTPTKSTFDPSKTSVGVHLQQGRVQTDADWNEKVEACRRQNEALKKQMKLRSDDLEIKLRQLEAAVNKADAEKKSSSDHTRATKDAIRKLLDQVAEMNRASRL
jgi:hypothetical protein